jgi:hypothetical protein
MEFFGLLRPSTKVTVTTTFFEGCERNNVYTGEKIPLNWRAIQKFAPTSAVHSREDNNLPCVQVAGHLLKDIRGQSMKVVEFPSVPSDLTGLKTGLHCWVEG